MSRLNLFLRRHSPASSVLPTWQTNAVDLQDPARRAAPLLALSELVLGSSAFSGRPLGLSTFAISLTPKLMMDTTENQYRRHDPRVAGR
jgi:hypothetical protein